MRASARDDGGPSGGPPRAGWIAWLAVALLAAALRVPVAELPFERDEGEYAYIAQRWLAGDVPYRDAFDQKPPGIFAFYAAAFGLGGESPAAVRWAAQALTVAALGALFALGTRLFSASVGLAAALAGLVLSADPSWLGNAVNTEQVAAAPLACGALAAWRAGRGDRAALAAAVGALGGVALLLKPVTAPVVAFQIATAVWPAQRRGRLAAAAAAGVAAPIVPVAAWFAAHGAGSELLDAVVWNNLAYAGETPLARYPAYLAAQLGPTLLPLGPLYAAAAAAPLALLPAAQATRATRRRLAWLVGWLAASLGAVAAGGYFRAHYFALAMPPLALLAGAGLDAAARLALGRGRAATWAAPATALALVAWSVAVQWWFFAPGPAEAKLQRIYGSNPFPEAPLLGRWIASRSAPGDRLFVYGSEPQLLFYAGRESASRYIFVYPLNMPLPAAAERQREALAEIDSAPPRFVVGVFARTSQLEQPGTPPHLKRGLRERIARDYEVAAVVPYTADRRARVLEGRPARTMWNERPLWDGATPWAAFVVWERRAAPAGL